MFKPLGEEAQTGPIPVHDFDQVGFATAAHEQMARERVLPQYGLHQHGEPVDALAHLGVAQGQVDLQTSSTQRHGHGTRSSSLSTASEEALTSTLCAVPNTRASAAFTSCFQRNSTHAAIPYRDASQPTRA